MAADRPMQVGMIGLGRMGSNLVLDPDDIVIDGGNSYYRDDITRAAACWRAANS